jgi:hypothetical protein
MLKFVYGVGLQKSGPNKKLRQKRGANPLFTMSVHDGFIAFKSTGKSPQWLPKTQHSFKNPNSTLTWFAIS